MSLIWFEWFISWVISMSRLLSIRLHIPFFLVKYNFSVLGLQACPCDFCQRYSCSLIYLCCFVHYRKYCIIFYFRERFYLHEDPCQFKAGTFRNTLALPTDLINKLLIFFLVLLQTLVNFVKNWILLVVPAVPYSKFCLFLN